MNVSSGLLNLNKPGGWTSRQVVDRVQRITSGAKAGHAGTLDPLASGVLVVCLGGASRLIEYVQRMRKQYRATFLLGRHSPTEDTEGDVTELQNPPIPYRAQVAAAAQALTGPILQRPPAYSAIKIQGRRAYAMARKGKPLELQPRPVEVYRFELEGYDYPELTVQIECGSGTYVRSLGRDLAESLGTAAVMSRLTRTAIGRFRIEEAIDPEALTSENWSDFLLPPLRAVEMLPQITLTEQEIARIRSGQAIVTPAVAGGNGSAGPEITPQEGAEIAAVNICGRLVAILTCRSDHLLWPTRNLPPEE